MVRTNFHLSRAVGRSENPWVPVVIRWALSVSPVEIGLTDLPKSGGAMAPLAPPGTTGLLSIAHLQKPGTTLV